MPSGGRSYGKSRAAPTRRKSKAPSPNARAVARANANAAFKRTNPRSPSGSPGPITRPPVRPAPATNRGPSQLDQFLSGIGQLGAKFDAAARSIFPAGRGNTISDAMRTGQDPNNPLRRILPKR